MIADQAKDPTMARTRDAHNRCGECGNTEIAFRITPFRRDDDPMNLLFICTNEVCRNVWEQAPTGP